VTRKQTTFLALILFLAGVSFGQEIDFTKYREIDLFDYRVQENSNGNIFYGYFKMTLYFYEQRSTRVGFKDEYGDEIWMNANTRLSFRNGQKVYVYFHAKRSGWDSIRREYIGNWIDVTLDYILEAQYPFREIVIDIKNPSSFVGQSVSVLQRIGVIAKRVFNTNNFYSDVYYLTIDDTNIIESNVHEEIICYVKYIRKNLPLETKESIIDYSRGMLGRPISSNEDDTRIYITWWSNPNISRLFMNPAIKAYHIYYYKESQELIEIWDIASG